MIRLELPDVMLCAVTGVAQDETVAALRECTRRVAFGDAVLLSQFKPPSLADEAFRWEQIEPIISKEQYSHFICGRLSGFVTRPHVLLVQWDGFVIDPERWDDAFLGYDYIGATWPQFDGVHSVGNGGFSLRSKRLLEAVAADFEPAHPEDTAICRDWRERLESTHGIRFAPPEVAERFARERHKGGGPTFGFHGLFLLPGVMPSAALDGLLTSLDASLLASRDAEDLLLELARRRRCSLAAALFLKRVRRAGMTRRSMTLFFRLLLIAIIGRGPG